MDLLKTTACSAIDDHEKELQKLSSVIWHYAEPSKKEVKTCKAIKVFLKKKKFKITTFPWIPTGFIADFGEDEFGGQSTPNIGILCRYDATQKLGHTQGNNLQAEVAVGAALGLQAVFRSSTAQLGKVTVIGCPDSVDGGLIAFLNRRLLTGVDVVLTAAPGSRTVWCPCYQGSKTLRAHYRGHPGNQTKVIPPADALAAAVYAYHNILAVQQHFGRGWHANGIIPMGGKKPSESQIECETVVKLKAPTNKELFLIEKRVVPCLEAAARATRCQLSLSLAQKCLFSVINNTMLVYCLQLNAYHVGVLSTPLKTPEFQAPVDVGNLSRQIPVARPIFYIGADAAVGTKEFKEAALSQQAHYYAIAMAKTLAMTAVDLLHTPGTLASVKDEHKMNVQREKSVVFPSFQKPDPPNFRKAVITAPVPGDANTGWSRSS